MDGRPCASRTEPGLQADPLPRWTLTCDDTITRPRRSAQGPQGRRAPRPRPHESGRRSLANDGCRCRASRRRTMNHDPTVTRVRKTAEEYEAWRDLQAVLEKRDRCGGPRARASMTTDRRRTEKVPPAAASTTGGTSVATAPVRCRFRWRRRCHCQHRSSTCVWTTCRPG